MHKKWNSEERQSQIAERKWLETYKPPAKISGKYIYAVPDYVYAALGGFRKLHGGRNVDTD